MIKTQKIIFSSHDVKYPSYWTRWRNLAILDPLTGVAIVHVLVTYIFTLSRQKCFWPVSSVGRAPDRYPDAPGSILGGASFYFFIFKRIMLSRYFYHASFKTNFIQNKYHFPFH